MPASLGADCAPVTPLQHALQPCTDAGVLAAVRQELAEATQLAERQRALGPGVRAVVKDAGGGTGTPGETEVEDGGRGGAGGALVSSSDGSGRGGAGAKRQRSGGQSIAGDGTAVGRQHTTRADQPDSSAADATAGPSS